MRYPQDTMIAYSQVSAFTETPGHGNQAGVVLDASGLDADTMQAIASTLGVPETVFVTATHGDTAWVRYFTPTQEIDFCGHATVALGLVLAQRGHWRGGTLTLETMVGRIDLDLELDSGAPRRVWMRQKDLELRPVDRALRARIAGALGIDERLLHRGLPLVSASTGLWSTFVPVVDTFVVDAVEPDHAAITALSHDLDVTSLYVYAPTSPKTFYARDFAPAVGIPEDPVTGSSGGALIAMLAATGAIPRRGDLAVGYLQQGHALGTPGEVCVEVTLRGDRPHVIRVGGCAIVEREGKM